MVMTYNAIKYFFGKYADNTYTIANIEAVWPLYMSPLHDPYNLDFSCLHSQFFELSGSIVAFENISLTPKTTAKNMSALYATVSPTNKNMYTNDTTMNTVIITSTTR